MSSIPMTIRLIGGPTALLEIGGLRLLTDPTFDPPGDHPVGQRTLVKTEGPSVPVESLGRIDAVLLSHDQHPDNLDDAGRRLLGSVPLVLSTADAARRLGGSTRELPSWRSVTLDRPDGGQLRVTGVPAQHGPAGTEHLTGEVRGFVLSGIDLPTIYLSGDNAALAVVEEVADHAGPIDVAILFAGHARTPVMDAYLTFSSDQAARAAAILDAPTVIVMHVDGWQHLTQHADTVHAAFARHHLTDRLLPLPHGRPTRIPIRG